MFSVSNINRTTGVWTFTNSTTAITFTANVSYDTTLYGVANAASYAYSIINLNGISDTPPTLNYLEDPASGTFTITPETITLTAGSAQQIYDGVTTLTDSSYTYTGTFYGTDGFASVITSGSQTTIGSSANTISSYTLTGGTIAGNYNIVTVAGTLTVTGDLDVYVNIDNSSVIYDGQDQDIVITLTYDGILYTVSNIDRSTGIWTFTSSATFLTFTANIAYDTTLYGVSDAATYAYTFTNLGHISDAPLVIHYTDAAAAGNFVIIPETITLIAADAQKTFDGTPLTANAYYYAGTFYGTDGFASVTITGSQTLIGTNGNIITAYTFTGGTNSGNYNIVTVDGILVVNGSLDVYVNIDSSNVTYDAQNQDIGITLTYDGLIYTVSNIDRTTGIWTFTNSTTAITFTANVLYDATLYGVINAATYQYTFADVDGISDAPPTIHYTNAPDTGNFTVDPITITITSPSAQKPYDGTPLTANTYVVTGAFVGTDGLLYIIVTGSQTAVGSGPNTITYQFDAGTLASNYNIILVNGTLTVTPEPPPPPPPPPTPPQNNPGLNAFQDAATLFYSADGPSIRNLSHELSGKTMDVLSIRKDEIRHQDIGFAFGDDLNLLNWLGKNNAEMNLENITHSTSYDGFFLLYLSSGKTLSSDSIPENVMETTTLESEPNDGINFKWNFVPENEKETEAEPVSEEVSALLNMDFSSMPKIAWLHQRPDFAADSFEAALNGLMRDLA